MPLLEAKADIREIKPQDGYRKFERGDCHYYCDGEEIIEEQFYIKLEGSCLKKPIST